MRRNRSCGLFVFAAAALLAGCGKRDERLPAAPPVAQQASLPVTNFAPPVRPTVPDTPLLPETVAELQGSAETPVLAKDSGYLVKQVYRENAIVAAGDLLFVIDPRPFHPDAPGSGHDDAGLIKIVAPARGAMSRALRGAGDWVNARRRALFRGDSRSRECLFFTRERRERKAARRIRRDPSPTDREPSREYRVAVARRQHLSAKGNRDGDDAGYPEHCGCGHLSQSEFPASSRRICESARSRAVRFGWRVRCLC